MRYRTLDEHGDMTFGLGSINYFINIPEAVAQAAMTRLRLLTGEWFLDILEGTPYSTQVLGKNTATIYDTAIRERILETEGVTEIVNYSSALVGRSLSINALINTLYGETVLTGVL